MSGYQEILTDPSYKGQIVTMTYPLIGNYGVNREDVESWKPHVGGFVIRELSPVVSNWRAELPLAQYLEENNIPGIQGIDTRALTRKLRVRGRVERLHFNRGDFDAEALRRAKSGLDWPALDTSKRSRIGNVPLGRKRCAERSASLWFQGATEADAKNFASPFAAGGHSCRKASRLRNEIQYPAGDYVSAVSKSPCCPANCPAEEALKHKPAGIFLRMGPAILQPWAMLSRASAI